MTFLKDGAELFGELQKEAREASRGLWGIGGRYGDG